MVISESEPKQAAKTCERKKSRPKTLHGHTFKIRTGCGALYVTINLLEGDFFELFARSGKTGGCASSQCEAIGRLISLAWRNGVKTDEIVTQLSGISCHRRNPVDADGVSSCADAIARAIKECADLVSDERQKVSESCQNHAS